MSFDPKTAKLVIYMDSELLKQNSSTGETRLPNLKFERKVAGTSFIIYQSTRPVTFSDANYFDWKELYKIGAFKNILQDGALVL